MTAMRAILLMTSDQILARFGLPNEVAPGGGRVQNWDYLSGTNKVVFTFVGDRLISFHTRFE